MMIRTLPRRRPSKNKRQNGRSVRCAILDSRWVPPNVRIELWLLDRERREVQRARDRSGQVVEFTATTLRPALVEAVQPIGEGFYRLTGRGPDGRIVARRDFEAMWPWRSEAEAPRYEPRNEVERVTGALRAAEAATLAAEAARDTAEARATALAAVVAERDEQLEVLERALSECRAQLDGAWRLYWRSGAGRGVAVDVEHERGAGGDSDDDLGREGWRADAARSSGPDRRAGAAQSPVADRTTGAAQSPVAGRTTGAASSSGPARRPGDDASTASPHAGDSAPSNSAGKAATSPLFDDAVIARVERTIDVLARLADRFKGSTDKATASTSPPSTPASEASS